MKFLSITIICCLAFTFSFAQGTICNANGNLVIFSNYDGGMININVDVNIPNLKIGIVSYEADSINLSGAFVNNVTGVAWAGYNGTNHHCALPVITNTTIHGAPGGATTNIAVLPASPLNNPNGYSLIVCNYSCDINSNQGGCNTSDQVEAYFLQQFPGSSIYSNFTQYGCWTATKNISAGGNCCATVIPFSVSSSSVNETCFGSCNGSATASPSGGQAPYSYTWNNGATTATANNLCAGTYSVIVADSGSNSSTQTITITGPAAISSSQTYSGCEGFTVTVGTNTYSSSGTYTDVFLSSTNCDSTVTTILSILPSPVISAQPVDQVILNGFNALFLVATPDTSSTFQWQVNSGSGFSDLTNTTPYSGATDDSLIITGATLSMDSFSYRCTITSGICSDTSAEAILTVKNSTSLSEIYEKSVSIYPNPTEGKIYIADFIPAKIIVMNSIGLIILDKYNTSRISLDEFPDGIYLIRVFDGNEFPLQQQKIIKF
ncbi:MAG: T9SS type A sorting domain-containing protein [Bacteroidota bacterium]